MSSSSTDIFIVAYETKDRSCLEAFVPELSAGGLRVRHIDLFQDLVNGTIDNFQAFIASPFPVAIIASVSGGDVLRSLRPAESFLCIGVEHGFAPFKGYTYDRGLLQADYYLAPSAGWAERLIRLYPDQRAKVRIGGYPKVEAMRALAMAALAEEPAGNEPTTMGRMLVILSWGVNEATLRDLPDLEWIDYLLHPGDADKVSTTCLSEARVHISQPDLTLKLIANAEVVVGDFSSLTLECIYLGKLVTFLFDRSLYTAACDFDPAFLDRESAEFGRIPHSSERISVDCVLSVSEFKDAIECSYDLQAFIASTPRAAFPPSFVPSQAALGRSGGSEIMRIISQEAELRAALPVSEKNSADAYQALGELQIITRLYQATLGRMPDFEGLQHYQQTLGNIAGPPIAQVLSISAQLSGSAEAQERHGRDAADALTQGLQLLVEAEFQCGSTAPVLCAISDFLQAETWRERRDETDAPAARVYWGMRLAGAQQASGTDYAELACDTARIGQYDAALLWISKARNSGYAGTDILLLEADLLQQLGRLDDALVSARKALTTAPAAAELLIGRLEAGLADDLRRSCESKDVFEASIAALRLTQKGAPAPSLPSNCGLLLLAALGRAARQDYIELAHACAQRDELRDALYWLEKAKSAEEPDGELLRFEASILERSGQTRQALRTAAQAKRAGASMPCIEEDIARIKARRRHEIWSVSRVTKSRLKDRR